MKFGGPGRLKQKCQMHRCEATDAPRQAKRKRTELPPPQPLQPLQQQPYGRAGETADGADQGRASDEDEVSATEEAVLQDHMLFLKRYLGDEAVAAEHRGGEEQPSSAHAPGVLGGGSATSPSAAARPVELAPRQALATGGGRAGAEVSVCDSPDAPSAEQEQQQQQQQQSGQSMLSSLSSLRKKSSLAKSKRAADGAGPPSGEPHSDAAPPAPLQRPGLAAVPTVATKVVMEVKDVERRSVVGGQLTMQMDGRAVVCVPAAPGAHLAKSVAVIAAPEPPDEPPAIADPVNADEVAAEPLTDSPECRQDAKDAVSTPLRLQSFPGPGRKGDAQETHRCGCMTCDHVGCVC